MPNTKLRLLVVENEPAVRTSLCLALSELGYEVRAAENGFSALSELRKAPPDILISDLHMPAMSGFELLSVVRRRFPAIPVIAMSSAFAGDAIPEGVAADRFYPKSSGIDVLLMAIASSSSSQRIPRTQAPIWIAQNGHNSSGDAFVTLACPECLRTFPQVLSHLTRSITSTNCIHCAALISFAIATASCV
jgi:CheY-like chemotaxis protein